MKLIGMLDSPYVRRVAISLQLLGLPFEHRSVSVFRGFAEFERINPVVKAPTLVCDDATVLMDSGLILDYAEALAGPGRSLMPAGIAERLQALHCIGLALAACEKGVQIVYERNLRPADKQHAPWIERVRGQLFAALSGLEAEAAQRPFAARRETIDQAGVTAAVVWRFLVAALADVVDPARYPRLAAYSAQAETLPEFAAAPHGEGLVTAQAQAAAGR